MKKISVFLLLFVTFFSHSVQANTELDRPVLSQIEKHGVQVWGQYDYFSTDLDFANYTDKIASTSSLDDYSEIKVGIRYGIIDDLNIRYSFGFLQQEASRATEPKIVASDAYTHDLKLQYQFYHVDNLHWAAELGYRTHIAKPEDFYSYQFGNNFVTWGGRPLVTTDGDDYAWTCALRGAMELGDHFMLHAGVEVRRVTVNALMTSENPLVQSLLAPDAPQTTPWDETHLLLQTAIDWHPHPLVSLALDYTRYEISRSGYEPNPAKVDYNSQDQLDGFLFLHLGEHLSLYGHGRLNSHFVLGDIPLAYNRRVNHKFEHPFGFVSAGMSWSL